ncbi:chemotaxis protein CheA [Parablautia muri]|uniref:Chemotaxis protein CheA n=1 Tax=Parablautia muri TaxID=2320879 RepID=A0A9X5GTY4_9FIRM|nr:chemotaxis protein CheA [Parablautia muri]NBJ93492.1 chemotaxis protein CheA [Parablautia muri]
MDVNQYLEIFLDETKEHLESLNTQILNLEQEPEDSDTINEIFRAAHSLKGMAGTMGYKRMQNLTHDMENVFSEIRNGTMKVNSNLIDTLFQCLDALEEYTNNIQETADEGTNENQQLINQLNEYLKASKEGGEVSAPSEEVKENGKETSEENKAEEAWKDIKLGESERVVLEAAKSQGKGIFGISVFVEESCLLKAARAFQVYKEIEEKAEIIVCNPPVQDIEDEKFDLSFSLIVVSDYELEGVIKEAKNVSEIEKIVIVPYEVAETAEAPETKEGTAAVAVKEETKPAAPAKPQQGASAKANDKKPAGKPVANRTVRVDIEKLDVLMNLVSELIIAKNSMVADSRAEGGTGFREHIEYLESVTTNLHESVMKVRMVPIESVVSKFPRMIRDLSKKLNKKMELYMSGEETELDRTVVDEIGDPLMHLLRNAADHGLESNELRIKRGKPEVGSIFLNAYQDGNNVVIEVKDDGNGIDVESVKNKAIERGVITPDQAATMSEKDIINLLFHAGFSTAKTISDVSGRGVGLDVVKSKIESLSGEVEVKSSLEEGSTWTIRLPLTLAIIQALMVTVGGEKYAVSLGSIQTIEDISPDDVKLVENREVINLRGSVIPIIRLSDELDIESSKAPDENIMVVIVKKGERLAGLVVDELIGQQEIVIKSLGKYISKCRIISGATILGDGEVALILDANALI